MMNQEDFEKFDQIGETNEDPTNHLKNDVEIKRMKFT